MIPGDQPMFHDDAFGLINAHAHSSNENFIHYFKATLFLIFIDPFKVRSRHAFRFLPLRLNMFVAGSIFV
jgi:hypothetical protein